MSPKRRIFISRRKRSGLSIAFVTLTLLALVAACAPEASHWSPNQRVKRNDVRWVTFEHQVRFEPGQTELSAGEKSGIRRFLTSNNAGYGDRILIGARGNRRDDIEVRRAVRREAAVSAQLREFDARARLLPEVPSNKAWDGSIKIVLGRFVVVPPECPDWTKPATGDPANRVSSNFGCATATNLGLMLADPGDLVRGRKPGPADGAAGARLYNAYREGEQQQGPAITPLVIQSGVNGGGGGQ